MKSEKLIMRKIKIKAPIKLNGKLRIIEIIGYKFDEEYAYYDISQLKELYIYRYSIYKWRIWYKLDDYYCFVKKY